MKKRVLAVLLSLAAVLTLSVGCKPASSSSSVRLNPKKPVTISIWHYYNGVQKSAFDTLLAEFNETVGVEQGIIVEGFNQGNVGQLTESVLASASKAVGAEPIPNVFAAYADTVHQIDQLGLVASLDPYLTAEELAQYLPAYIEEGRLGADNALKIFPIAKSTEIFMLNKTDWEPFAAATGAELSSLATMEGLVETARSYYEWSNGKAFFGRDAMANYLIIGAKQLGSEIFAVENGAVTFTLDPKVMRTLWDHYYVPYISGYFLSNGRFRSDDAKVGDLIALVGSTSAASYFPTEVIPAGKDPYPIEIITLPVPTFAAGSPVAVQQGAGMVVTKATPEVEYACTVFLKWFTEEERNLRFSALSGYLPVKQSASDPKKLAAALDTLGSDAPSPILLDTLKTASETVLNYQMYTNRAFAGGTDARGVLDRSLQDLAVADRKAVLALVEDGARLEEAVWQYNTEEHFQEWLKKMNSDLVATQKG